MRIQMKLMIAVAVNILVFVSVIFFVIRPYFIERSLEQDRLALDNQVESVYETLASRKVALERILLDWGIWSDTYNFVQGKDENFIESNLGKSSLVNLGINGMVFLNRDGKVHHSTFDEDSVSIPKEDEAEFVADLASRIQNLNETFNGVYASSYGPVLYASHPILQNDESGPPQGTLIMVQFIGDAFIGDISAQTKIPLTLREEESPQIQIDVQDQVTDVSLPLELVFREADFEVEFTVAQTYYKNTVAMLRSGVLALLFLGAVLLLTILWTIHHVVIRRLIEIGSELKRITIERDSRIRLRRNVRSRDEIEQMAMSMNEVLAALEDTKKEVINRAFRDTLTQLPNRLAVEDYFSQVKQSHERIGVIGIDLDDFRRVNDQFGHRTGDDILIFIASRLNFYKEDGFVARIGADEFILMRPDWTLDELQPITRRFLKDLEDWAKANGVKGLAATIGLDVFDCVYAHHTYEMMMGRLDVVIHEAKLSGKNRVFSFQDIESGSHYLQTLEMERDLRHALEHDEFELYYQPIVAPRPFAVQGVEALIRWNHPEKGQISPGLFIPVAEQIGLISELGRWVLQQGIKEMNEHVIQHELFLSVNVSKRQIADGSFLASLEEVLNETGFDPMRLHVEITESEVGGNLYDLQQFIQTLKDIGVKISLDDFGVGTSSLSFLQSLQVDSIKIDQNFVKGIPEKTFDRALLEGLYQTFHTLGIDIITEGVERPEQLAFVLEHSSSLIQGYHYSKPVPLAQLEHYLKKTVTMYDW